MKKIYTFLFFLLNFCVVITPAETKAESIDQNKVDANSLSIGSDLSGANSGPGGDELLYKQIVRKRLYPGGRDEEPLRVQMQMSQPTRKMGPATEAPESAASDD